MNRTSTLRIAVTAVLFLGWVLEPIAAQTGSSCSDPKSHQFDFWIGSWEVYADGSLAGHNTIEPILDGCVLQESWQGSSGSAGTSLNFFNLQTERWQQFWVWRNGTTLDLEGGIVGDRITDHTTVRRNLERGMRRIECEDPKIRAIVFPNPLECVVHSDRGRVPRLRDDVRTIRVVRAAMDARPLPIAIDGAGHDAGESVETRLNGMERDVEGLAQVVRPNHGFAIGRMGLALA